MLVHTSAIWRLVVVSAGVYTCGIACAYCGADDPTRLPNSRGPSHLSECVTITVERSPSKDAWTFVLARLGNEASARRYDVGKESVSSIDPIDTLGLRFESDELRTALAGNQSIPILAALTTGDGLVANCVARGWDCPARFHRVTSGSPDKSTQVRSTAW